MLRYQSSYGEPHCPNHKCSPFASNFRYACKEKYVRYSFRFEKLWVTVKSVMAVSGLLLDPSSVSRVKNTICRQVWVYLCHSLFSCCRLFVVLCQERSGLVICFNEDRCARILAWWRSAPISSPSPTRVALDVLIFLWYSRCPAVVSL